MQLSAEFPLPYSYQVLCSDSPTGLGQYFAIIDAISQDATPNRLYIYVLNVCVLADNIGLEVAI